jgi:hypothetical protein
MDCSSRTDVERVRPLTQHSARPEGRPRRFEELAGEQRRDPDIQGFDGSEMIAS